MKVTEKGQVTIPLEIREALGIRRASEVEFSLCGDHAVLRKIIKPELLSERIEQYKGVADSGMTTEQILALTRS